MRILYSTLTFTCLVLASMDAPSDAPPERIAPHEAGVAPYAQAALDAYGDGYAIVERAARLEEDARAASRNRDALMSDARLAYKDALERFELAIGADSRMYEAHTYVGYVLRKLDNHEEALAAYEKALDLKPDYVRAIEYQGEAFLGLNRFEDAKRNYLRLYALDAERADRLLDAMHQWVAATRHAGRNREATSAASAWLRTRPRPPASSRRLTHW